ncbi:MAG: cytochrome c oxidase assembly protein [Rhodobacteraceae bacterium]|nr:cytochrome c oxidase assembly protein [Paracoccaceae bacterium]
MARTTFRRGREGVSRFAEEFTIPHRASPPDRADAASQRAPRMSLADAAAAPGRGGLGGFAAQAAILGFGVLLWAVSRWYPADMPAIGPYDFSATIYLAVAFTGFWYLRGLARSAPADRPAAWRIASFLAGLGLLYLVVQTGLEYPMQRMFFLHRIQHVVLHHIGPVLIGLSMAGPVILRGAPRGLGLIAASRPMRAVMRVIQHPVPATLLFSGSFYFWLYPPLHFVAMLNRPLYELMNWTMAVDGILFWAMVLDTRPFPLAHARFGTRAALAVAVMFPQIVLGAIITFSTRDLYPYYAYCGRYFPSISAVTDQQIGGIVIWIPPAMMSVLGLLVVLGNMNRAEVKARAGRR